MRRNKKIVKSGLDKGGHYNYPSSQEFVGLKNNRFNLTYKNLLMI